jgi:carboxypeptidase Taq
MEPELTDWKDQIGKGNFRNVRQWLTKNVHSYGNLYDPRDLLKKITGEDINVHPYISYLNNKFSEVYEY